MERLPVQEAKDNITDIREIYDCVMKGRQGLHKINERFTEEKKILRRLPKLSDPCPLMFRVRSSVKVLTNLSVIRD